MKRLVSWVLIAALMIGFVGMIAFNAFAAEITRIEIQTPVYGAGSAATLDGITVTGATLDTQVSKWCEIDADYNWNDFTGTLQENGNYTLQLGFTGEEGSFGDETVVIVNGEPWEGGMGYAGDGTYLEININVDLRPERAEWAEVGSLPEAIQVGAAVAPEVSVVGGYATVASVRWVDADKNAVTAFEVGKVYYLEIKFAPKEGYVFREWFDTYGYYSAEESQVISATEAVAWFRYSTLPSVGKITVTSSGLGEGKPFSGISAKIEGNATLKEVAVYDVTAEEMVENGKFQSGKNYQITYHLVPKAGYEFGKDLEVELNGNFEMGWNHDAQDLYVTEYFSTCKKIETVKVTVTEPKVGGKVADAKVTLPKNAPYTVVASWIDMEDYSEATGTFKKGHKYQLCVDFAPAEGYVFAADTKILINGKEEQYGNVSSSGFYAWAYQEYSFMNKITKVELPAMPASIQKGDTLPKDFTVAADANYTLQAEWGLMPNGGAPEKADENGSYVLVYNVTAKAGYEFDEDAVVTVGGKKLDIVLNYGEEIQVFKAYNIGMKTIDKVELTVNAPNKGNKPEEPKFSKNGNYESVDYYWGQNKTGDVMDNSTQITKFQEGYYCFLSGVLMAEDGYAFADKVDIYVNGKKMAAAAVINMGSHYQYAVSFGKLGKASNSDTGDTTVVGAWICLSVVALCGMAVTAAGKKKYCA